MGAPISGTATNCLLIYASNVECRIDEVLGKVYEDFRGAIKIPSSWARSHCDGSKLGRAKLELTI